MYCFAVSIHSKSTVYLFSVYLSSQSIFVCFYFIGSFGRRVIRCLMETGGGGIGAQKVAYVFLPGKASGKPMGIVINLFDLGVKHTTDVLTWTLDNFPA